jgi:hypothetical protein
MTRQMHCQSAAEMHLVACSTWWSAWAPTCACLHMNLREDDGMRCGECHALVVAREGLDRW